MSCPIPAWRGAQWARAWRGNRFRLQRGHRCCRARARASVSVSAFHRPELHEIDPYVPQEGDTDEVRELKKLGSEARDAAISERDEAVADVKQKLETLEADGVPAWLLSKMRAMGQRAVDATEERLQEDLRSLDQQQREALQRAYCMRDPEWVAQEQARLQREAEVAAAELKAAAEKLSQPGPHVSILLGTSFLIAAVVTGLGGLVGLPATRQLALPPFATWDGLEMQLAMWTLPYVVGTMAYYSVVRTGGDNRVIRPGLKLEVLQQLSLPTMVAVAAGVSLAQCVVYQGMMQCAVLRFLGAPLSAWGGLEVEDLLQPALDTATGGLVDPQALPWLVWVPLASLGVGLVEAGVSTLLRLVKWRTTTHFQDDELVEIEIKAVSDPRELSPEEQGDLWLTAGRVAMSGTWLAAETAVTGSLALAVATSTAGLLAGLLVARSQPAHETDSLTPGSS